MPRKFDEALNYVADVTTRGLQQQESIKEARRILTDLPTKLEFFEIAQLANLMPEKAEEAKSLIPSLMFRIEDDELQVD